MSKNIEWSGEDELVITDSLEWDSYKALSQISRETGIPEEKVAIVLEHLIESKFAIEKKGTLYKHLDLDNLDEMFDDE